MVEKIDVHFFAGVIPLVLHQKSFDSVIGARFVWRMEDIMDLHAEPYQPAFPVICFDEVPYRMALKLRATPGRAQGALFGATPVNGSAHK